MQSSEEDLRRGLTLADKSGRPILYRYLASSDNVEATTTLLHEAYTPLAEAGMRFVASYQDSDVTRRRMAKGETFVATDAARLVGIVTLATVGSTSGSPFYDRADVASFGQFAVRPSHQGFGIGSTLMTLVERRLLNKAS